MLLDSYMNTAQNTTTLNREPYDDELGVEGLRRMIVRMDGDRRTTNRNTPDRRES